MDKIYLCEYCDSEFNIKNELINHKKQCTKKLQCDSCPAYFNTQQELLNHVKDCSQNKHECYGCNKKFRTIKDLKIHQNKCSEALKKCCWIKLSNKGIETKCCFLGPYGKGYCKKHFIDYIACSFNGIIEEVDGEKYKETCSCTNIKKYLPKSIKHMMSGIFFSLDYTSGSNKYNIESKNDSSISMRNIETNEIEIFWESKDTRKNKDGKLITSLRAVYELECDSMAIIKMKDETTYCKNCFEGRFNTTSESLIEI